jgi:hypothetical protein
MKSLMSKVILSMVLSVWTLSNNPAYARKPLPIKEYQKFSPVLERINLRKLKIDELGTIDAAGRLNANCASIAKNLCVVVGYELDLEKELPDKIITSKKVRGRLIKIISGDYFYAQVSTKYGEETFLIDGNEDCFMRKHSKEQLSIDYDVLDRYTPQASGYRQVNIIRNITTRRTSLKKWRMTLAKNKLGQCNH